MPILARHIFPARTFETAFISMFLLYVCIIVCSNYFYNKHIQHTVNVKFSYVSLEPDKIFTMLCLEI